MSKEQSLLHFGFLFILNKAFCGMSQIIQSGRITLQQAVVEQVELWRQLGHNAEGVFSLERLGETSATKLLLQGYLAATLVLQKHWDSWAIFLHLSINVFLLYLLFQDGDKPHLSPRLAGKILLRAGDSLWKWKIYQNAKCLHYSLDTEQTQQCRKGIPQGGLSIFKLAYFPWSLTTDFILSLLLFHSRLNYIILWQIRANWHVNSRQRFLQGPVFLQIHQKAL